MVGKSGYISVLIEIDTLAGITTGVTIPGLYSAMLNTYKPILATIKVKSTNATGVSWITYFSGPTATIISATGLYNGAIAHFTVDSADLIKLVE